MRIKIITNIGVKTLPKDFKFPITSVSTSDYDKDGLTDWQEVDHDVLGKGVFYLNKSDLPLYLDYAFRKGKNSKNPFKKFEGNAYINNQLLQVKFLPIVSDPTYKPILSSEFMFVDGKVNADGTINNEKLKYIP